MSESKNLVNPNARSEDWDDTAILNSFESGIMSFRTKAQSKPTATNVGTAVKDVTGEPITSTVRGNNKRTPPANESGEIESGSAKRVRFPQEDPLVPKTSVDADEKGETVGSLPLPTSTGLPIHDEALQSMLMAWYYSGYATGRYQALKEIEDAAAATAAVASTETKTEDIALDQNTA